MSQPQNTRIVLASRPQGPVKPDNFRIEAVPVSVPGDGEILLKILFLSLDPYMRGRMDDAESYAAPVAVDAVMEGGTVAEVIESK
ncbi:NADP-dependent oxidoreductase, partial [Escherichia coli]|nr:NADP-dependent oxidoreductase [Escherichia coli]